MPAKFVIKKSKEGRFQWLFKSGNGETVLESEMYGTKQSALKVIEGVRRAAKTPQAFERKATKSGKTAFVILQTNREIVGSAQTYATPSSAMRGIKSVQKNAPDAAVVDETVDTSSTHTASH